VEEELKAAKQLNKAAIAIIIIMSVLMVFMVVNMRHLAEKYRQLEYRYEQLYEEVSST